MQQTSARTIRHLQVVGQPLDADDAVGHTTLSRRVVPGYDLLRELAVQCMKSILPERGDLLVVGPGPGSELVRLARALPGWFIEAVDPSIAMCVAATQAVDAAGLGGRVVVRRTGPMPREPQWDAAFCLFCTHLLTDVAERRAFWKNPGASLRSGARLLLAEVEAVDVETQSIWLDWAGAHGGHFERFEDLEQKLGGSVPTVSPERTQELAEAAGFCDERTVCQVLGVVAKLWQRVA